MFTSDDEWDPFFFSQWLDAQGLLRGEAETADPRTHEDLTRQFLADRRHTGRPDGMPGPAAMHVVPHVPAT